jgi:hypothetical protein
VTAAHLGERRASGGGRSRADLGAEAARALWQHWDKRPAVDDPFHPDFANAALREFELLQEEMPGVLREVIESAERGASQLTTDPYHGIYEVVQNADDLGASHVRVTARRSPDELLLVHDGERVRLAHVLAMTYAFLSTKRSEARSKGRFGVGLKTLSQLGGRLSVHSPPYHFGIEQGRLWRLEPAGRVRGFYRGSAGETLLVLRTGAAFDAAGLADWFENVEAAALLFLDSVRELSLVDIRSGKRRIERRLVAEQRPSVELGFRSERLPAEVVELFDPSAPGTRWLRYRVDYPVPRTQRRAHKATGEWTPLSVAVPNRFRPGLLAAGLPFPMHLELPLFLNAQFDPDTGRAGIRELSWNEWLFSRIADAVAGVALARFEADPSSGWLAVPRAAEADVGGEPWVTTQLEGLTDTVRERLEARLVFEVDGQPRRLSELVYEQEGLGGLLSAEDYAALAPGAAPLPTKARDRARRWRDVLEEFDEVEQITVREVLQYYARSDDALAGRSTGFLVRLLAAAVASGDDDLLPRIGCVVLSDGERVAPNGQTVFAKDVAPDALAARLGLLRVLHPAYFANNSAARSARAWLTAANLLVDAAGAEAALLALAARDPTQPFALNDRDLLSVRTALLAQPASQREDIGRRIGRVILLDGYHWEADKRIAAKVAPAHAYLPTEISRDTRGWAQAAARTEGIMWIDSRYVAVLREGASEGTRARAFLRLLGAEVAPRVEDAPLPGSTTMYGRTAVPIRTDWQRRPLKGVYATHLLNDKVAPDLSRVIADIERQRVDKQRRARARALLETLERSWGRFADEATATAVYPGGRWNFAAEVPATWLAEAAGRRWMSNKRGQKRAPHEVAVQTPGTESVFGRDAARYGYEVDGAAADSPLLAALGVQGEPPVTAIIAELEGLRERFGSETSWADVEGHYAAIAARCPARVASESDEVGDTTVRQLRRAFGPGNGAGLVLAHDRWVDPAEVLRGRAMFGGRRQFVPASPQFDPLWRTLRIREPAAADALAVAREIAASGELAPGDREALCEAYRLLADGVQTNARLRRDVARLPLLTTAGWTTERPIVAAEDRPLHDVLARHLPVWVLPCALESLKELPQVLGVQVARRDELRATGLRGSNPADPEVLETWQHALDNLAHYLADTDHQLWESGAWPSLRKLKLVAAPNLTLSIKIGTQRPVALEQRAHVDHATNTLFFRDEDVFRERELGGRLVSKFFSRDQPLVALAFVDAWRRAEEAPPSELLRLIEETAVTDELNRLGERARAARGTPLFSGAAANNPSAATPAAPRTTQLTSPRSLKDFRNARIGTVQLVEGGEQKEVITPQRPQLIEPPAFSSRPARDRRAAPRSYTDAEREDEALQLLAGALKTIDRVKLRDFRHLPVGADSADELRRFFEIKAFGGEMRDEVRLEPSQLQRALRSTDAFFLAIVSGLETGATRIRIIANPLRHLTISEGRQIRLRGVTSAAALELSIETDRRADE